MRPDFQNVGQLLAGFNEYKEDIAFVRALRNLKVETPSGTVGIVAGDGSENASLDLRSLTATAVPDVGVIPSPTGHANSVLMTDGTTVFWQSVPANYTTWKARVAAAGGSFTSKSKAIAFKLALALSTASYASKLKYLLPFLGGNLSAALVPLVDSLNVGAPANSNFVAADFSEATGLTGNGSTKFLDTTIKPGALNSGLGGMGYIPHTVNPVLQGDGASVLGSEIYGLQFRITGGTLRRFWWGDGSSLTGDTTGPANSNYYGQRSATNTRQLYVDGILKATNSTAGILTNGLNTASLYLFAFNSNPGTTQVSADTAACFYLTDGTLTDPEVSALNTLLRSYLITPTGR